MCVLVAPGGVKGGRVPPRVSGGNRADGGQSWAASVPLWVCPVFPISADGLREDVLFSLEGFFYICYLRAVGDLSCSPVKHTHTRTHMF